jgi:hypothetical protein
MNFLSPSEWFLALIFAILISWNISLFRQRRFVAAFAARLAVIQLDLDRLKAVEAGHRDASKL